MKSVVRFAFFGAVAASAAAVALVACGSDSGSAINCGPGTVQQGNTCVPGSGDGAQTADGTIPNGDGAGNDANQGSETGSDAGVDTGPPNRCPFGKGPAMAEVPRPDGGTFCMDTTEVTESNYDTFLLTGPTIDPKCGVQQFPPFDKNNGSCGTYKYDPSVKPASPVVCIDFCMAATYCKWAGKRLCRGYVKPAPGLVQDSDKIEASWVCSNGHKSQWPYGTVLKQGQCVDPQFDGGDGKSIARPVKSAPNCHGINNPYSAVYDLVGNVIEWQDFCVAGMNGEDCLAFAGAYDWTSEDGDCYGGGTATTNKIFYSEDLGFRCCAD